MKISKTTAASQSAGGVRLLFDKESGRILYMEAGKHFVDLLFNFLLLPAGTVIQLLSKPEEEARRFVQLLAKSEEDEEADAMIRSFGNAEEEEEEEEDAIGMIGLFGDAEEGEEEAGKQKEEEKEEEEEEEGRRRCKDIGSIVNVYKSVEHLKDAVFAHHGREVLLQSLPAHGLGRRNPLLLENPPSPEANIRMYKCGCPVDPIFTLQRGLRCSQCRGRARQEVMLYRCICGRSISPFAQVLRQEREECQHVTTEELKLINFPGGDIPAQNGFVKENMTFIITDDLEVIPSSAIDSIMLLKKLKVEKISLLQSAEVSVTAKEVLALLLASFTSQTALTDVFSANVSSKGQ